MQSLFTLHLKHTHLLKEHSAGHATLCQCEAEPLMSKLVRWMLSPPSQGLPWWRAWSNELREEMHRRRGDRRMPPGQVDKLPSSWSVTLNAVLSV